MEKVSIEIEKTTLQKLKELSETLDFMGDPIEKDQIYNDLIISIVRYINKQRKSK
jgi:hypothetical protein